MLDLITAIADLIILGDYTSPLRTIGLEEDHPLIDLILTITGR